MIFQSKYPASLLCILSIQQPSVLSDLQLQPGLDVEQHLVFTGLPLNVSLHLTQLALQAVNDGLELVQLQAVAGLRLSKLALQGSFLQEEEKASREQRFPPRPGPDHRSMFDSPG